MLRIVKNLLNLCGVMALLLGAALAGAEKVTSGTDPHSGEMVLASAAVAPAEMSAGRTRLLAEVPSAVPSAELVGDSVGYGPASGAGVSPGSFSSPIPGDAWGASPASAGGGGGGGHLFPFACFPHLPY